MSSIILTYFGWPTKNPPKRVLCEMLLVD